MRARLRRLGLGLSTLLGPTPGGFFIPYRYAASVEPQGYPALRPLFEAAEPAFRAICDAVEAVANDLAAIRGGEGPARFDQDWFPRLDAAAAYALVRRERPKSIVEVGSGHSTRFLARAVSDGGLATAIVCIDPRPRAELDGLDVEHRRQLLRDADPGLFDRLAANDMLFVDSSHVAIPGTDVDRLLLDVLPRLAAGVLIHFHDIFLPDDYPAEWRWRGYNEQLPVGALLQGGAYELVFSSHYVSAHTPGLLGGILAALPLVRGAHEASLWLRKR